MRTTLLICCLALSTVVSAQINRPIWFNLSSGVTQNYPDYDSKGIVPFSVEVRYALSDRIQTGLLLIDPMIIYKSSHQLDHFRISETKGSLAFMATGTYYLLLGRTRPFVGAGVGAVYVGRSFIRLFGTGPGYLPGQTIPAHFQPGALLRVGVVHKLLNLTLEYVGLRATTVEVIVPNSNVRSIQSQNAYIALKLGLDLRVR